MFEVSKFRWGQSRVREILPFLVIPAVIVLGYQIFFRRRRKKGGATTGDVDRVWPGLDSEFYKLEAALAARGVPREPGETLADWLERLAKTPDLAELRGPMKELLRLHYRYRFDPLGLSEADREVFRAETRACLDRLSRAEEAAVGK
jgi:hypothetical protein